jgi:hypothetical protein
MPQLPPHVNYLVVNNQTQNELKVTGYYGGELNDSVVIGQLIPPGQSVGVAQFHNGSSGDYWDWVYLLDVTDEAEYQIYVEYRHDVWSQYFGFSLHAHDHKNPNPCPFPEGTATVQQAGGICLYTLNTIPPQTHCSSLQANQT